jgi:hypothetical protein
VLALFRGRGRRTQEDGGGGAAPILLKYLFPPLRRTIPCRKAHFTAERGERGVRKKRSFMIAP